MIRKAFLNDLLTIKPALADKDLIPDLTNVWFTGKEIMTYNNQIGISVNCPTPFTAGARGAILIELIRVSTQKEISFTKSESLEITFGNKKPDKLTLFETDKPIFEMPPKDDKYKLPVDANAFIAAIKNCLRSTSNDTSAPEKIGITLIVKKRELKLFSTDGQTISTESLPLKADVPFSRVILSVPFCEQLVALGDAKAIQIEIHEDYSRASFDNRITLFGNVVGETDTPLDFEGVMKENVPPNYTKHIPIPQRFESVIERALVITSAKTGTSETTFSIKEGMMTIRSKSKELGEVSDRLKLEGDHPEAKIQIHCKHLKKDLKMFTKMFITEKCWIMMNDNSIYLIAAS